MEPPQPQGTKLQFTLLIFITNKYYYIILGKLQFGTLWLGEVQIWYPERKIFAVWCPVVCSVNELVPCALFSLEFNGKCALKCQKPTNKSSLMHLSPFSLLKGIKT